MKALSDTIQAMRLPEAMPRGPQHGLTTTGGQRSIAPQTVEAIRAVGLQAKAGQVVTDASLEGLLRQHFGSRLVLKEKTRTTADFDVVREGYLVEIDALADDEMRLFDMIDYLNKPSEPKFVAGEVARLRVSMPRRDEENQDIELLVDTLVDDCREFPPDLLHSVFQSWRREERFFPTPRELRRRLVAATALRRAVRDAFERARNPLLQRDEVKKIAAPLPRTEKPKEQWNQQDWLDYISDAEGMLALAQKNPSMIDVAGWEEEVKRRKNEMPIDLAA